MLTKEEQGNAQIPANAFSEGELERFLNQKPEDKYQFSEPPPARK
jgi:hypothetical protein